jgi:hypothetical protein
LTLIRRSVPLQASCPSTPGGQFWVTLNYTCGLSGGQAELLPSFYQVRGLSANVRALR